MAGFIIWLKAWLIGNIISSILIWYTGLEIAIAVLVISFIGSIWTIIPNNILINWFRTNRPEQVIPMTFTINALITNISVILIVEGVALNLHVGGFRFPWPYMAAFTISCAIAVWTSKKILTKPKNPKLL